MATILDAFNAAAGAGNAALSIMDRNLRETADAKLRTQQLDMQRFMAEQMQDFSTRTDWQNFRKDWNDRFTRKYNEYNGAQGASAYQNQYTAKLGNQLLDQMKAQGDIAMQKMIVQGQRNEVLAEKNNQLALLENDAPTQERLDAQAQILDELYAGAYIDYGKYAQAKQDAYARTQALATTDWLYGEVAKNPALLDKTDAELSEYAMTRAPRIEATLRGADGTERQLAMNRRGVNDEALKAVKIRVRGVQEAEAKELERTFLSINESVAWGTAGAEDIVSAIQGQIKHIRGLDGLHITDDAKTREVRRLEGLLTAVTGAATGGSGAKADAQKKAFLNMIKDKQENIVDKILIGKKNAIGVEGYGNYYEGLEAFKRVLQDAAAQNGVTEAELRDFYPRLLNDFTVAVMKRGKELNPELDAALRKLNKIPDEWAKNKVYKDNPALLEEDRRLMAEYVLQGIARLDASDINVTAVSDLMNEYFEKRTSAALLAMEADPEKAARDYAGDRGFARGLAAAGSDLGFYGLSGKPMLIGGGDTGSRLRELEEKERRTLKELFGAASVVPMGYELTDGGLDISSEMLWKVGEDVYKYGLGENGKPALLVRDGSEWKEYKGSATARQAKKERDERMRAERKSMLESDTMPDISSVRDKLPADLRDYTQEEWGAPLPSVIAETGANTRARERKARLVDAVLNEKYFGKGSTAYKTEKESAAQAERTAGYEEEAAVARMKESRGEDARKIQERSEEIRREGLPAGKVLVRSPAGGVISAVDSDRVPRGYVTVEWDELTASQKKDVADSLAETEVYGKPGGKRQ